MQTRQWMTTHEWMVKPMPQREWIERRGMMVWIAEVFTSLGTGLYLVSLFMNNWWGMAVGWLIIMFLKLPIHLAYFGKPLRFYRTIPPFSNAWKTSWFARGILFTIFFSSFAIVQLAIRNPYFDFSPYLGAAEAPLYWFFATLGGTFALLTGIYGGFIMNYCKSVPFWNNGLLPVAFILAGIADGFGLIMAIGLAGGDVAGGHQAAPGHRRHRGLAGRRLLAPMPQGGLHLADGPHHLRQLQDGGRGPVVGAGQGAVQGEVLFDDAGPQGHRR